jgi:hypothetical protein
MVVLRKRLSDNGTYSARQQLFFLLPVFRLAMLLAFNELVMASMQVIFIACRGTESFNWILIATSYNSPYYK